MSENIKSFTDQNWETDVSNTEGLVSLMSWQMIIPLTE